jgi:large subunit ribosomal protein L35
MLTPSIFAFSTIRDVVLKLLEGEKLVMPKIKTNRAAAKRFKKTGTGKIAYRKSGANHILTKKTTKRKRSLRKDHLISKSDRKSIRLLLPNG